MAEGIASPEGPWEGLLRPQSHSRYDHILTSHPGMEFPGPLLREQICHGALGIVKITLILGCPGKPTQCSGGP